MSNSTDILIEHRGTVQRNRLVADADGVITEVLYPTEAWMVKLTVEGFESLAEGNRLSLENDEGVVVTDFVIIEISKP